MENSTSKYKFYSYSLLYINALPLAIGGKKSLIFNVNFLLYLSIRTVMCSPQVYLQFLWDMCWPWHTVPCLQQISNFSGCFSRIRWLTWNDMCNKKVDSASTSCPSKGRFFWENCEGICIKLGQSDLPGWKCIRIASPREKGWGGGERGEEVGLR